MRRGAVPLLGLLAGCAAGEIEAEQPSSSPPVPEPWLPDLAVEPPEAVLGADQVGPVVAERLAEMITWAPTGFPAALDAALEHAEPGCPDVVVGDARSTRNLRLSGTCTTAAGAEFVGSLTLETFVDRPAEGGGTQTGGSLFSGGFGFTGPGGEALDLDGFWYWSHNTGETFESGYAIGDGRMAASDDLATDPWLRGEASGYVELFLGDYSGYRLAVVSGTTNLDEPDVVGLSFADLRYEPGLCDEGLLGVASLRERSGVWHDVTFARLDEETEIVEGCGPCGAWQIGGAPAEADVCVELDALEPVLDFDGGIPW